MTTNGDWLARRVLELEEENGRLRHRVAMLAETVALLSAGDTVTVTVTDNQFSMLVSEGERRAQ